MSPPLGPTSRGAPPLLPTMTHEPSPVHQSPPAATHMKSWRTRSSSCAVVAACFIKSSAADWALPAGGRGRCRRGGQGQRHGHGQGGEVGLGLPLAGCGQVH